MEKRCRERKCVGGPSLPFIFDLTIARNVSPFPSVYECSSPGLEQEWPTAWRIMLVMNMQIRYPIMSTITQACDDAGRHRQKFRRSGGPPEQRLTSSTSSISYDTPGGRDGQDQGHNLSLGYIHNLDNNTILEHKLI
jgi:hypothetical protein